MIFNRTCRRVPRGLRMCSRSGTHVRAPPSRATRNCGLLRCTCERSRGLCSAAQCQRHCCRSRSTCRPMVQPAVLVSHAAPAAKTSSASLRPFVYFVVCMHGVLLCSAVCVCSRATYHLLRPCMPCAMTIAAGCECRPPCRGPRVCIPHARLWWA